MPQQNYGYKSGEFQKMKKLVAGIREPAPKQAPPQQQPEH
jgi:hypothetical protein